MFRVFAHVYGCRHFGTDEKIHSLLPALRNLPLFASPVPGSGDSFTFQNLASIQGNLYFEVVCSPLQLSASNKCESLGR